MMPKMFQAVRVGELNPLIGRRDVRSRADVYRKYFRGVSIACPANALRLDTVARRVVRQGSSVDVRHGCDFGVAITAGVSPDRIIVHCDGLTDGEIRCARMAKAGRLVLTSANHVRTVACCSDRARPQNVVLNLGGPDFDTVVAAALADPRLRVIGLHSHVDDSAGCIRAIDRLMQKIDLIRSCYGVRLDCVGLSTRGAMDAPVRGMAAAVESAVEDACIRYRLPRPLVTLSPEVRTGLCR